jgi:hypothetical protein
MICGTYLLYSGVFKNQTESLQSIESKKDFGLTSSELYSSIKRYIMFFDHLLSRPIPRIKKTCLKEIKFSNMPKNISNIWIMIKQNEKILYSFKHKNKEVIPIENCFVLGDFVVLIYSAQRDDKLTKLFRFTYSTLFISKNEKKIKIKKNQLDLQNKILDEKFLLEVSFEFLENNDVEETEYKNEIEKLVQNSQNYHLKERKKDLLSHVKVETHKLNMNQICSQIVTFDMSNLNSIEAKETKLINFDEFQSNETEAINCNESEKINNLDTFFLNVSNNFENSIIEENQNDESTQNEESKSNTPPPIPPPMFLNFNSEKKKSNMKRIHWRGLTNNNIEETSLWSKMSTPRAKEKMDKKLEDLFKIEDKKEKVLVTQPNKDKKVENIIDMKKARNIEIILSQFKNIENEIPRIIDEIDLSQLDSSKSNSLLQLIPTEEEEESLKKIEKEVNEGEILLSRVDSLIFKIIKVNRYKNKIKLIDHLLKADTFFSINNLLDIKINSIHQILNCENFHKLLINILNVGNSLNEGNNNL